MEQLTVKTALSEYPIYIDNGLLSNPACFDRSIEAQQVFIVTNETVSPLYLSQLKKTLKNFSIHVFEMNDGERFKSFQTFELIQEALISQHYRRNATLIALGGGVVGDISGFSAACYQRGIPFIQVPTTLLAMVDSSVGGKTAINHPLAKNMVGAFYQPKAVIADLDCLNTLPNREFAAGMAEVVKYGLIYDFDLFEFIEQHLTEISERDSDVMKKIIKRCCEIKAIIVNEDEQEKGIRAILNLGHTFGHALEKAGNYETLLHGEAVAIGTCMAFELAILEERIDREYKQRVMDLFAHLSLPTYYHHKVDDNNLLSTMRHDKKNLTSHLRFIVPTGKGKVEIMEIDSISNIRQAAFSHIRE